MRDLGKDQLHQLIKLPNAVLALKLLLGLVGFLVVLSLLRTILRWLRRPKPVSLVDSSLVVDLGSLPLPSADPTDLRLSVYHVPVRLAVVVIAPLGRDAEAPTQSEAQRMLDTTVPGLAEVVRHDRPIVRIWPRQLSATGFTNSLARHLRMPGEKGRGTPWCLVAGRTSAGDQSFAVGLALVAAAPNNLTLIAIESEHQWLDILRLRQQ